MKEISEESIEVVKEVQNGYQYTFGELIDYYSSVKSNKTGTVILYNKNKDTLEEQLWVHLKPVLKYCHGFTGKFPLFHYFKLFDIDILCWSHDTTDNLTHEFICYFPNNFKYNEVVNERELDGL